MSDSTTRDEGGDELLARLLNLLDAPEGRAGLDPQAMRQAAQQRLHRLHDDPMERARLQQIAARAESELADVPPSLRNTDEREEHAPLRRVNQDTQAAVHAAGGRASAALRTTGSGRPRDKQAERDLLAAAHDGSMADHLARNPEVGNAALYGIVSDVVFEMITRRAELGRAHYRCAASASRLEPDCHDRHQDNVEAVLADVLRHIQHPIVNLRAFIASRALPATIDGHRRRRAAVGAQQRPRLPLPRWLDTALAGDQWLSALAIEILVWVGVPTAAPTGLWPLTAWVGRHAAVTGVASYTEAQVAADVEQVLTAMRTNPTWFAKYVERPLASKRPVSTLSLSDTEDSLNVRPLVSPDQIADAWLATLAADAIDAIEQRVRAGEELRSVVIDVLGSVFDTGTRTEEVDQIPGAEAPIDERIVRLLADPIAVDRIVEAIASILKGRR